MPAFHPQYCCFYLHAEVRVGWVRGRARNRLDIVLEDGSNLRRHPGDLLYSWEGESFPVQEETAPEESAPEGREGKPKLGNVEDSAIAQLRQQAQKRGDAGDAGDAGAELGRTEWSEMSEAIHGRSEPGRKIPFAELAERELGGREHDWAHGTLFLALLRDRRRFRHAKGVFTARSAEEISRWNAREAERIDRDAWKARALARMEDLERGEWEQAAGGEAGEFLEQLQSLLALEKRSPHWAELGKWLGLSSLTPLDFAARLKGWLKTAGAWPGWPAIWLRGGEVPPHFAPALEEAAGPMAIAPLRTGGRRDFRALPAYSIDAAGTQDFDDAYSILETNGGGRGAMVLALHIAEPDPSLEPGHPLFEEAARRMATVYTLAGIFPMLPSALGAGRFSLLAGEERETVTLRIRLREGETELIDIERGLVRLERNLDFAGAQRLLEERPADWGLLALRCQELTDARSNRGAVVIERKEVGLDIGDPEAIRVWGVSRSGPVHQIVEELAIAYNGEAGRYCGDHGLPAIYRVQPVPPVSPGSPAGGGEGGAGGDDGETQWSARFSTLPEPHAGLACERYVQATSPLRRFTDFVMQRQIISHFTGQEMPFPERTQLAGWAARADERFARYAAVARRIENDWKRRYLTQSLRRDSGREFSARVGKGGQGSRGRIRLEALQLNAHCLLPSGYHDGDTVQVRIESVDRDREEVWVAPTKSVPDPVPE